MEFFLSLIDIFLHLDLHLEAMAVRYGAWIYLILFLIIFCETGLVITPILPGDSLLFAAGALSGMGMLNGYYLWLGVLGMAILGDAVNYWIGSRLGVKPFKEEARIFKLRYLYKTEAFYEKHGGKTIVLARFIPIVRTFAPFVAGASHMHYPRFAWYNVFGAFLWATLMLGAGHLFGNIPWIKANFSFMVLGIIFLSCLPIFWEGFKSWQESKNKVASLKKND